MRVRVKMVLRLFLAILAVVIGGVVANQHVPAAHAFPNTVACSYPGAPDCNMGGGSMGCCGSSMPSSGCCGSTLPPTTCLNALLCGSPAGLGGCAYGQIFVGGICTAPGQSSSGSACIGSLNALLSNGCVQSSSGPAPALGSNVPQQSAGTVCINAVTTGCTQGSSAGANNAIPAMNPVGPSQTQPGPSCTYGGNAPPNSQCGECPDGFNTYAPGQSSLCPPGTSCNYGGMVYGANSRCFVCPDGVLTTAMASACPQGTPCSTGIAYAPSTCTQCPGPPANGTAATPSQCPPSTTCPDGSSHWPPYDPCPAAPSPAANASISTSGCGGSSGSSGSSRLLPLMDALVDGTTAPSSLPPFITPIVPGSCPAPGGPSDASSLPSGLNTGSGTPFDTCSALLAAPSAVLPGVAFSAEYGNGSASIDPDFCSSLANSVPAGADPNQWMACLNAALFPNATHAGTASQAVQYNYTSDQAKAACMSLVPNTASGASVSVSSSPAAAPNTATLPSGLNTGPNTPYDSCVGLTVGATGTGPAGPLVGGLGGGVCAGLTNSVPSGSDPNQWMACLNAALFPGATHAGGSSNAVQYDLTPDQAKLACSQLVPGASAGGS